MATKTIGEKFVGESLMLLAKQIPWTAGQNLTEALLIACQAPILSNKLEPKILAGITEQSKKHKILFDVLTYDLSSQLIDDKRIAYIYRLRISRRTHSFKLIYSLLPMNDEYDVLPAFALIS